ncbi:hypothetical protein PTSG_06273 [Salpingoeca rosetta]|uniref:Uncharacterized protein n=1 Tax=Salpingoeca rosetta (strain ATCC 50818 / BSB-021) TaxID=946362 RepID=F2UCF7_SALR5|nr:uncharacterized protein PTSG_06273 [Salpingoeca rosetta]EGD74264.1 hypothetical protein PTSG_06273 [Salpingoeca rosetta]|eukprot:XP_004993164.1 hypothetical protein PTSG_06273 [Salpingoeca rosetta]
MSLMGSLATAATAMSQSGPWKAAIAQQLDRLSHRYDGIAPLFDAYTRLLKQNKQLKDENRVIKDELDEAKEEMIARRRSNTRSGRKAKDNVVDAVEFEKLHTRYSEQCEELLRVYKERAQVNHSELLARQRAQDLEAEMTELKQRLERAEEAKGSHLELIETLNSMIDQRDMSISSLKDELSALSLQYTLVEEKRQEVEQERNELLSRMLEMKQQQADMQNDLLAEVTRKRHEKIAKDIEDAQKELPDADEMPSILRLGLPTKATHNLDAHPGGAFSVAHSCSGSLFASGGADATVKVWNSSGHNTQSLREHTGTVTCIDFAPAGDTMVSASNDKSVLIWSLRTSRSTFRCTGHTDKVYTARFLGHTKVVSASQDRTMKLWNAARGISERTYLLHSTCYDIASVDGPRFLSGHFDKYVREWDTRQSGTKPVRELNTEHREAIVAVALSPTRDYLLTSCRDGQLKLVDLLQMRVVKSFTSDDATGQSACHPSFSPDGAHFAVGRQSGVIEIWNIHKTEIVQTLSSACHAGPVNCVSWGSSELVSAGKDGRLIVWEDDSLST